MNPAVAPWGALQAEALVGLGRPEEALPLAEADVARARAFGAPGAISRTLRALAAAQGADGLAALEEAAAAVDGSPAKLEHAKALAALGRALRLARRPTEAREPLRRALELARPAGRRRWSSSPVRSCSRPAHARAPPRWPVPAR